MPSQAHQRTTRAAARQHERLVRFSDGRLDAANDRLGLLRQQPLDPHVLDEVSRTEREAERWTRTSAALARNGGSVGLLEDPGSVMARVFNRVREEWRGSGLQVSGSFRRMNPRCFDRRLYMEAIHTVTDLILGAMHLPRLLEGQLSANAAEGLIADLLVTGDDAIELNDDEINLARWIVERAGGELEINSSATQLRACLELDDTNRRRERPRAFVFPLRNAS